MYSFIKKQKGITLIALVITIIVLLLLAGVAISMLSGENGLLRQAAEAKKQTENASILEQIQLATSGALVEGKGVITEESLKNALDYQFKENEYSLSNNGDGTFSVTIKESQKVYKVDKGNVEYSMSLTDIPDYDKIKRYFLGENGEGNILYKSVDYEPESGLINVATMKFTNNEIIPDAEDNLKIENMISDESSENNGYGYVRYNGVLYEVYIVDTEEEIENSTMIAKKVNIKYVPCEDKLLGKYVTYKGKDWIVLYDDDKNGLQLISAENVGDVTLGHDNSQYATYGDNVTDMDKVVAEYNNAIDKLNQACKDLTGITENIRCVGGPEKDTTTDYFTSSGIDPYTGTWFKDYEGKFKEADENYINDYNQIVNLGISTMLNGTEFWMASRATYSPNNHYSSDESTAFYVRKIESGYISYETLCSFMYYYRGSFSARGRENTAGVRPVITLDSTIRQSISSQTSHSGTIDDPYVIE